MARRLTALLLAAVLMMVLVPALPAHAATVVTFPDPNLEAAVRQALNKPTGGITDVDMAGLTILGAGSDGVSNLQGLQYATNLKTLYLDFNRVSDLSPIKGLSKLTSLQLFSNQVSDVSPLAGLTTLTNLRLDYNRISDVSALAGLTNLTDLKVGGSQLTDISALAGLTKITNLQLYENRISDVSPLAGLTNLTWLDLDTNQIADVSPLAGLTKLSTLYLFSNRISDISALVANPGLGAGDTVYLYNNYLDLSAGSKNMAGINALIGRGASVYYSPQLSPPGSSSTTTVTTTTTTTTATTTTSTTPTTTVRKTGTVTVSVKDRSGRPVSGAAVTFTGQVMLRGKTGIAGTVSFVNVPFGTYRLQVQKSHYNGYAATAIVNSAQQTFFVTLG